MLDSVAMQLPKNHAGLRVSSMAAMLTQWQQRMLGLGAVSDLARGEGGMVFLSQQQRMPAAALSLAVRDVAITPDPAVVENDNRLRSHTRILPHISVCKGNQ